MKSRWLVGAALALAILWFSAQGISLFATQPSSDSAVFVTETELARQSIASHHPGLTAVTFRVDAPYPPADQPVTLVVRDADTLTEVVSVTLPFSGTAGPCIEPCGLDARGMTFPLPNQPDSAGREYVIDVLTKGAPLILAAHTVDMYSEGQLLRPATTGDLAFRLDYNSQLGAMAPSVARQIASGRPGISGSVGWVPGIVLVYVIVVILVLRKSHTLFSGW